MKRPPDASARAAASRASCPVVRKAGQMTSVPRPMRRVRVAAQASRTSGSWPVTRPTGRSMNGWSITHAESKPSSSTRAIVSTTSPTPNIRPLSASQTCTNTPTFTGVEISRSRGGDDRGDDVRLDHGEHAHQAGQDQAVADRPPEDVALGADLVHAGRPDRQV